jgi:Fic family protein
MEWTGNLNVSIFQIKMDKYHSLTVSQRGQSEFRAGEVIYTPPRGPGVIEQLMDNLLDYLNDDERFDANPLLKMCIAHYQLEAIHPFPDGNQPTHQQHT